MATPRWAQYWERYDAENHPDGNEDVYNRANKDIYATLGVGHNDDGTHKLQGVLLFEQGTYTGDGNDDRDIALTNTDLQIMFIIISRADTEAPVFASSSMDTDKTKQVGTNAFAADMIQAIDTAGEFTIGADAAVNANGIAYHYAAWGVKG